MKKLVLMFAVVFSASLFSCNNTETAATTNDSIDTTVVEAVEVVDSVVVDSVVADSAAADTVKA